MIDLVNLIGTWLPRLCAPFFPDMLWRGPDRDRAAYLTFDDGPTAAMTARLIDLLARHGLTGVFFVVGAHAARDAGLVRALHEAGHALGNHTYTHPDAWHTPRADLLDELDRTTKLLEDQVQIPIRWMRPPYGRFTRAMRTWCQNHGQRLAMWDVGPGDYLPGTTPAVIERRIVELLRPGSVVVLHDNPKARHVTPAALESALERLLGEGWRFPRL